METNDEKKDKREVMDGLIYEHLHRFTENNLFRASLDNFMETGKASGSFRAALHAMMEEYSKDVYNAGMMCERILAKDKIEALQKQVEELRKEKERLQEWKREMMQLNKSIFDWGHSKETELQIGSSIFAEAAKRLYAYRHLESENAAANKRIEELFKEKQELERKYNLLRYGSE